MIFLLNPTRQQTVLKIAHCPTFDCGHPRSSLYGGGKLFLQGVDFDATTYDNKVFVGQFPCHVDDYFTSETSLVCNLEYKFYDVTEEQEMTVVVKGIPVDLSRVHSKVLFTMDSTPVINFIYPSATWPGETVNIYGIHRAGTYKEIRSLKISNFNCEVEEDDLEDGSLNYWAHKTSRCKVPQGVPSGNHTVRMVGVYGTGYSKVMRSGENFRVGGDSEKYDLSIHPKIESVSPAEGYLSGQRVTITGKGFGDSKEGLEIETEGAKCVPESVSDTEVVCVFEKKNSVPNKKIYQGNAGLMRQHFSVNKDFDRLYSEYSDKNVDINEAFKEHPEGHEDKIASVSSILSLEENGNGSNYTVLMAGIFTAPTSGDYTFIATGDDRTRLLISKDPIDDSKELDEGEMLERVCEQTTPTHIRHMYSNEDQSFCTKKNMTKNKQYFMVYLHRQGGGGDHFTLGVEVPNTDNKKPNTVSQVQELKIVNAPDRAEETIKICNATSGSFVIIYNHKDAKNSPKITAAIPWKASANDVRLAIHRASGWWFTEVTLRTLAANQQPTNDEDAIRCYEYKIKFDGYRGDYEVPFVQKALVPANASVNLVRNREASPPVRGKFKLRFNNETTEEINYNEWMWWLKYKLEKLPSLAGGVSVYETGHNNDGKRWLIVMDSIKGASAGIQVAENNLTGGKTGKPGVTVKANYRASSTNQFFRPVGPDFLSTFHKKPQLRLVRDGTAAACPAQNCDYDFIADAQTPKVASFDINAKPVTIKLKEGFDSLPDAALLQAAENLTVTVGGYPCSSPTISGDTISCTLPQDSKSKNKIEAGSVVPQVHVKGKGFMLVEASEVSVPASVSSVSPSQGSTNGGTRLTISGSGFPEDMERLNVSVGNYPCKVESTSYETIVCITSPQTTAGSDQLTVEVNGVSASDASWFSYSAAKTPTLTSLDKNSASPILKQPLTITGTGFGNNPANVSVKLVPKSDPELYPLDCFNVNGEVSATRIKCNLPGGKSGEYKVEVFVKGQGASKANPANAGDLKLEMTFNPPSQSNGSLEGGHLLTITGTNFSSVPTDNQVVIGDKSDICFIESATSTEIKCRTRKPKEPLTGKQNVYVFGRIQESARCVGSCKYEFRADRTPQITGVNPTTVKAGDVVTIAGARLKSNNGGTSTVFVGGQKVPAENIDSINSSVIKFKMPAILDSEFVIGVEVDGYGKAAQANEIKVQNPFQVTAIEPRTGSGGGHIFVVTGNGFISPKKTTLKIGVQPCFIQSFATDRIVCWSWYVGGDSATVVMKVTNYVDSTNQQGHPVVTPVDKTCAQCSYTTQNAQAAKPVITQVTNKNDADLSNVTMTISGVNLKAGAATAKAYLFTQDSVNFPMLKTEGTAQAGSGAEEVDLSFENVSVGTYTVMYLVDGVGFAIRGGPAQNLEFAETGISVPTVSNQSFMGGNKLTISGKGFLPDDFRDKYSVSVCGNDCVLTKSSFEGLECTMPVLNTKEIQSELGLVAEAVLTQGSVFNDKNQIDNNLNDKDFSTVYRGNETCFYGYDFGEGRLASVSKIRLFPALGLNEKDLIGAKVQGAQESPDEDASWTTLFTIDENVVENWNTFTPGDGNDP